jgi:hypothetical protein
MVIQVVRDILDFRDATVVAIPAGAARVVTADDVAVNAWDADGIAGRAIWVATDDGAMVALGAGDFEVVSYANADEVVAVAAVTA